MTGRPSLYSPELVDAICEELAGGTPLAQICRREGMPDPSTVWDWEKAHPGVSQRIARAREVGFDSIAIDGLEIIDAPAVMVETQYGEKVDAGDVALRKARFDARMKLLSKWSPRYCDRTQVEAKVSFDLVDLLAKSGIDDRAPEPAPYTPKDPE